MNKKDSYSDLVNGGSGGTRPIIASKQEVKSKFLNNHKANPNMMFTLDEEDDETEYGESFKSSMKSTGKVPGKVAYIHKLP